MKKLTMSLAAFGFLVSMSACAADSYLYWMTDLNSSSEGYDKMSNFVYAQLKDTTGNAYGIAEKGDTGNTGIIGSAITDYASHSYYVELWNDDMSWMMGTSAPISGAWLAQYGHIYDHTQPGGLANPAQFTTFTYNAPEPTSGLLILLGVCGLALKRKRA